MSGMRGRVREAGALYFLYTRSGVSPLWREESQEGTLAFWDQVLELWWPVHQHLRSIWLKHLREVVYLHGIESNKRTFEKEVNDMGRGQGGGRGGGAGRGGGRGPGRMGGPKAAGPGGNCVCPSCGHKVPHQAGQPCYQMTCPKCGTKMTRE